MSGALTLASVEGAESAAPIGISEFAALLKRFEPFPENRRIAIAVSGGPDSMALAWCLRRQFGPTRLQAFIVDHTLRPESAAEAAAAQRRLANFDVQSEVLVWEHTPVVTRLHAEARKARYKLLIEACHNYGIVDLMLAHQLEDQAETILMRLAKGSGVDGLAGMRPENTVADVRLLRPLLDVSKERLVATCRTSRIDYIEDGSNRSPQFARGRLRNVMPLLAEEGLTLERLADLGARAGDAKDALDHYTDAFLRDAAARDETGVIRFDLEAFRALPRAIAGRALALGLRCIHAGDYAPEYASLMDVLDGLRKPAEMPARTLHGCYVSKSETQVTLMREASAITETLTINPGETVIWDESWQVTLAQDLPVSLTIKPLGNPEHDVLDALAPGLRKRVPQGRARAGLPSLWHEDTLAFIPSLTGEGPASARLVRDWPPG